MDRLTTRNPNGTIGVGHPLRYYNHEEIVQVLNRLAAYEDTGLTPEAIRGLCEMDKRCRNENGHCSIMYGCSVAQMGFCGYGRRREDAE